jgi:hypothetical protein
LFNLVKIVFAIANRIMESKGIFMKNSQELQNLSEEKKQKSALTKGGSHEEK